MQEIINSWSAPYFASQLIKHLRSRTMPGLPHIGVLGPEPDEDSIRNLPVDIDDADLQQLDRNSDDEEEGELDWEFVPNKMKYQLTIKPSAGNLNETKIDFYIRLKEGCDADVGKDLARRGRPSQYILSEEDLKRSFKHFEVFIYTFKDVSETKFKLLVDGEDKKIEQSDFKIQDKRAEITLHTESDPFITFKSGKPRIVKQDYYVLITKEVEDLDDGHRIIKVQIVNRSRKTGRSALMTIEKGETEDDCRNQMKAYAQKKGVDFEQDPLWSLYSPNLYKVRDVENNPEGNRYGYLMEFFATEKIASLEYPIGSKDMAQITNSVFDASNLKSNMSGIYEGEIIFRDHTSFLEEVPKMVSGSAPLTAFQRLGMDTRLALTLMEDMKYESLYKFQEDAMDKIIDTVKSNEKNTVLISARTAGGKTEAFLFPILDYCIKEHKQGVKAIIFYPTKALANDQASRFIKILYHLNKRLEKKITLGLLHGDVSKKSDELEESETAGLPFECPKCDIGLLRPTNSTTLICDNETCREKLDFVWAHSRPRNYAHPPDILITNPDTLIWDLMLRPEHHSIFGRSVFACKDCGMTYAPKTTKVTCNGKDGCDGRNIEKIDPIPPSFLVFDEIHLFKGSFGINCSYFLSRIENTIKHYAVRCHKIERHNITRVGSTATISNEEEFVEKFFNAEKNCYWIVPHSSKKEEYYVYGEADKSFKRYHVFVMPYAYTSDSTVGMAIHYLEALAKLGKPPTRLDVPNGKLDKYLQILTFVNSLKASNSLISQTKRTVAGELPDLQVDGHTTDFDKSQRSRVERRFNVHDLHVVFATSTLEVGVDFRSIHTVVINGFPYSFNDYLQRIGRGGRKNDSLIVTVCQNWKPVDHYYYAHGNSALLKQYQNIEPVPITRENTEAIKKHIQGSILDHIIRNDTGSGYDLEDITSFSELENNRNSINQDVLDSCSISSSLEEESLNYIGHFVHYLTELGKSTMTSGKHKALYSRFLDDINPKYNLTSLRNTDPEVTIEVFWNR